MCWLSWPTTHMILPHLHTFMDATNREVSHVITAQFVKEIKHYLFMNNGSHAENIRSTNCQQMHCF